MSKMRKQYLDNIRWITIILVVIFHIFFYYNNIGIDAMFDGLPAYGGAITFGGIFQYGVYPWFMLLLFVVGGMSAKYALEKKNSKQFMRARVDKLLVPSTLGVLAFGWIGGYIIYIHNAKPTMPEGTPGFVGAIIALCSGIGALWFCHVMFVAVLVLLLVRVIIKACKSSDTRVAGWFAEKVASVIWCIVIAAALYLILWGGSHILNMPLITSYRNGIYIPAFLMGYYIFSNEQVIERLKKSCLLLLLGALASGIFYIYRCYGLAYSDVQVLSRWDLNLYAFFMVLFVLGAGARFLDWSTTFSDYMKKCCFGIYVLHIPVLLVTNYLLVGTGLPMPVIYVIELASALVVSILLYELIRRIPVLRYWILGVRGKKNTATLS